MNVSVMTDFQCFLKSGFFLYRHTSSARKLIKYHLGEYLSQAHIRNVPWYLATDFIDS